jgi:Fe2+ or Zn2+ uptake regulation protein
MLAEAQKYLASNGIRPSLQRVAVMDYLMRNHTHPTVDDVHGALAPAMPTLSRMTVHNTLSMLAERGLILSLDLNTARIHYDGQMHPHAHFMCTRCGAIHDIEPTPELLTLYSAAPPAGVTLASAQMVYKGVCAACNAAATETEQTKTLTYVN